MDGYITSKHVTPNQCPRAHNQGKTLFKPAAPSLHPLHHPASPSTSSSFTISFSSSLSAISFNVISKNSGVEVSYASSDPITGCNSSQQRNDNQRYSPLVFSHSTAMVFSIFMIITTILLSLKTVLPKASGWISSVSDNTQLTG